MEIIVCLTTNGVVVTVNAGSITFRYTAVIEESMTRFLAGGGMLLSLPKETYHILLSSITIIFYNITLYE
jgi:hypothetical protein